MARNGGALVFAGDQPGSWWVVHCGRPRFAARVLGIDAFNAEPDWAALVPHGITPPLPVHFNLGADVLVITDFIDPITIDEGASPQTAILSQAMLDALHACSRAIARIARSDPAFAPLADRAEQFLVGWRVSGVDDGEIDLLHATGAQVNVRRGDDDEFVADLVQAPDAADGYGWAPELLHHRLQRVAGERAMMLMASGFDRVGDGDDVLDLDRFEQAVRDDPARLAWCALHEGGVAYVAIEWGEPARRRRWLSAIELDADAGLMPHAHPLSLDDAEAVLSLVPMYGLYGALNLVAAHRFGWPVNAVEAGDGGVHEASAPLPFHPCEVELLAEGEFHPAIVFGPADADGLFRLVIAPHGPPREAGDTDSLLPFDCVRVDRRHFHLPAYLTDGGNLP